MFGSPRIGLKALAGLCYRLGTAQGAGVDVRTTWAREAKAARGSSRAAFDRVSQAVNRGSSLKDAIAATDKFFPVLFHQMVAVGEESGHMAEIFRQLYEHYSHQLRLRKMFFSAISWPLTQLGIALAVVGLLIWVTGMIGDGRGKPVDILGFGLVGNAGLARYLLFLSAVAAVLFALVWIVRRGSLGAAPIQGALMRVPGIGRSLKTLALARLTWSLHLTMNAGMDLQRALALALDSTRNAHYTSHTASILTSIRAGREIHEAFERTGVFPHDFLDAVEVGEQSGRLVESLAMMSNRYQEDARGAMQMLTSVAGFAVWAIVAAMIVMLIFRIFGFYTGAINDALKAK